MKKRTYSDLQELTGHEAGAILYEDGKTIGILNWSGVRGIPRLFNSGFFGLAGELTARRVRVPAEVKQAMLDHEREQVGGKISKRGFRAWLVNDRYTVVISDSWN